MQHLFITSPLTHNQPNSPKGHQLHHHKHHHHHHPSHHHAPSSSSAFTLICILHSLIALFCGCLMMFHTERIYSLGHGIETANKLLGSTPHDQLLIRTSDSFAGLLLFAIGFFLLMVSCIKDREFQAFFAKGCTVLHVFMAVWRVCCERKVEDLAWDCMRQTVGDFLLALSWVFFVVCSWREKYD